MSKGNPFLALRLSPDQHDILRANAIESGITVSELVRQVIARYVASEDFRSAHVAQVRKTSSRRPSRPARLERAFNELGALLAEYYEWQENLPESLQESATAVALEDTIDRLSQAVDALIGAEPPRGFGRDRL